MLDHGDGSYTASYLVETAGEVQLILALHGGTSKCLFTVRCLPAAVAPAACEAEHGTVEVTAGRMGQLRLRTADRCGRPFAHASVAATWWRKGSATQRVTTLWMESDS